MTDDYGRRPRGPRVQATCPDCGYVRLVQGPRWAGQDVSGKLCGACEADSRARFHAHEAQRFRCKAAELRARRKVLPELGKP